jgi:hypothetical protein
VSNAAKVASALVALHKVLADSWATEMRNEADGKVSICLQASTERAHRKLAASFGLVPVWAPHGKTETLESTGELAGVPVRIFAPSRASRALPPSDIKATPAVREALALADEACR